MAEATIPKDEFSSELRRATAHPEAIRARSSFDRSDFYGNTETWTVETIRFAGEELVFLQRHGADDPRRLVLPNEVTKVLGVQRDRVISVARRRAANKGAATRKAKGFRPTPPRR